MEPTNTMPKDDNKQAEEVACKTINNSTIIDFNSTSEKIKLVSSTPKLSKPSLKRSRRNHLWIYNINPATSAQALKEKLAKYGNVVVAKIVKNANKFYGFSIMQNQAGVNACIKNLNRTYFNEYKIEVRADAPNVKAVARDLFSLSRNAAKKIRKHPETKHCFNRMKEAMKDMVILERKYEKQRIERRNLYERMKKEKRELKLQRVALEQEKVELDGLMKNIGTNEEQQKLELGVIKAQTGTKEENQEQKGLTNVAETDRALKESLQNSESECARLREELTKERMRIEALQKKIGAHEKDTLNLKNESAKQKGNAEFLKREVDKAKLAFLQKHNEVAAFKRQCAEETKRCEHLSVCLNKEKSEVEKLRQKTMKDEDELGRLRKEKMALQKDVAKLNKRIGEILYRPREPYSKYDWGCQRYDGDYRRL